MVSGVAALDSRASFIKSVSSAIDPVVRKSFRPHSRGYPRGYTCGYPSLLKRAGPVIYPPAPLQASCFLLNIGFYPTARQYFSALLHHSLPRQREVLSMGSRSPIAKAPGEDKSKDADSHEKLRFGGMNSICSKEQCGAEAIVDLRVESAPAYIPACICMCVLPC